MWMKYIFIILGVFFLNTFAPLFGQSNEDERIGSIEADLNNALLALRSVQKNEQIKALNDTFQLKLENVMEEDWFFEHPFSSLQSMGKIYSEDKEVRVISWNVQWENSTNSYFAYILKKEKRRSGHFVVQLKESKSLPKKPQNILDDENWYGALYYDIKDVQKGRKTYYTLFGYDGNNERSKIKLLDVLHFAGKSVKLGYPFFETSEGWSNRVFFEHSARAVMSLKYEENRDMIIFDHLSPESPNLAEFKEYYIPDMSYDAYTFEDNKWRLKEDIIALNKKESEMVELKAYDKELDTVVSIPVDSEWNNPEDPEAPIDGGGHRAVTLEDDNKKNRAEKDKSKETKEKEKETDFKGVSYSNLNKKKKKRKKRRKKRN
jgi:hypothetical protein